MTAQALFVQMAIIAFIGAALVGALFVARRGRVAPLVAFGGAVLVTRAGGFALNYYFAADEPPPVWLQAPQTWARAAPIVVLTTYVCLMQARRYRAARDNDFIRWLFRHALGIYGGLFVVMFAWDCVTQPPLLEYDSGYPVASWVVETAWHVTGTLYALLAAFVFFSAARGTRGPVGLGQRLQNLFFGIAILGAGLSAPVAVIQRGVRAFFPEEVTSALAQSFAVAEFITFVLTVGGLVLGIFSYYTQSKSDRFLERFSSFTELVGDLTEELASAPIGEKRLNLPYVTMHQAAGEEFLDLSPVDKRKMDNAFCARVVWEHRAGTNDDETEPWAGPRTGSRAGRLSRRRLRDLSEAYDHELEEPVLREGLLGGVCDGALPNTLMDLLPDKAGSGDAGSRSISPGTGHQGLGEALAIALETDVARDLSSLPEWAQLVYVALADAGLLPTSRRTAVLDGREVSRTVLDTYRLAEFKVSKYGQGVPRIFSHEHPAE